MVVEVAAGIILASIPYYLIRFGYKALKQDEFQWIAAFDKIIGFALILVGLTIGVLILLSTS